MADSDDGSWSAESEQQFWDGEPLRAETNSHTMSTQRDADNCFSAALNGILSSACATPEQLDEALRSWLDLVSKARDEYLDSEDDVARCSEMLLESQICRNHGDYVRTQLIYSLLQEEEFPQLHVYANFLLLDGRTEEKTFRTMINEGCFVRLLELIKICGARDSRLHRLLLQLMYEMSRIEHLRPEDLVHVDDAFVVYLFQLIEALSDDASDPYHYPVIRVLVCLPLPLRRVVEANDCDSWC
jgi:hypothetical protein